MRQPKVLIKQGKYECGPASLAVLLGHTLFNVKRVAGDLGWRNDSSGITNELLQLTARAFGRDLVFCGPKTIEALGDEAPDCLVSIRSLNYPKMAHGITWLDGEMVDPNFGHPTRKFHSADAKISQVDAHSLLVLAKQPLMLSIHQDLKYIRTKGSPEQIKEAILEVAA